MKRTIKNLTGTFSFSSGAPTNLCAGWQYTVFDALSHVWRLQ